MDGRQVSRTNGWRSGAGTAGVAALVAVAAGIASALLVRRQTRQAERDHPPRGRFMEVEGVRLHYIDRGRGVPVVMLHGNGATLDDFVLSGLVDRVAEKHRVIVFDRPGYGYSDRPRRGPWTPRVQARLLFHALQRLGAERPVVAAHSWGAQVAVAMALAFPRAVRGLVLIAGYYYPTARADVPLFAAPAVPALGDAMRYTVSPWLGRLILPRLERRVFAPRPIPPRFAEGFPHAFTVRPGQIRAEAEDAAFMIPAAIGLRRRYRELDLPVAILAGTDDRMVNAQRHSVRLHDDLPNSELALLPGIGHMLHWAAPDEVARAIAKIATATAVTTGVARPAVRPLPPRPEMRAAW